MSDPTPAHPAPAAPALPTRWRRRRGWLALARTLVLATAAPTMAWAAEPAAASAGPSTPTARAPLVTVVAGIVGYTRWPGDAAAVRLCTLGQGRGVDELLRAAELGNAQRSVSVRTAAHAAEAARTCDAIYVGGLSDTVRGDLLHEVVGRPVLLLGEGAAFCSDGGMFCLDAHTTVVRFQANLDAIARSGLRVNPMVLRIARQPSGSGS